MYHSGLGGGGFMLVRGSNGSYEFIDFREKAPAAAFQDMYKGNINASLYGGLARYSISSLNLHSTSSSILRSTICLDTLPCIFWFDIQEETWTTVKAGVLTFNHAPSRPSPI